VLGLGEGVRSAVTPNAKVIVGTTDVPDGGDVIVWTPDPDAADHD
jgi:hypothetical protein